MRNRRPDLNGLLILDKPLGWSSAKACAFVRRATDGAKVGHAGTLDPLATGVLVLALGRATKSIPLIQLMRKRYETTIDLSAFTTTDDREGDRTEITADAPPALDTIRRTLDDHFVGEIDQRPPTYSAIKIDGQRAYKRARSGENNLDAKIKPKRITIDSIDILNYAWPMLTLDIRCSKGTYIRSIARDLGTHLQTGGTLASLVRTAIGDYRLEDSLEPNSAAERAHSGALLPAPTP